MLFETACSPQLTNHCSKAFLQSNEATRCRGSSFPCCSTLRACEAPVWVIPSHRFAIVARGFAMAANNTQGARTPGERTAAHSPGGDQRDRSAILHAQEPAPHHRVNA